MEDAYSLPSTRSWIFESPGLRMLKSMGDSLVASTDAIAESRARPCGLAATNSGLALRALIIIMSVALSLGDVFSLVECKVNGKKPSVLLFIFGAALRSKGFLLLDILELRRQEISLAASKAL